MGGLAEKHSARQSGDRPPLVPRWQKRRIRFEGLRGILSRVSGFATEHAPGHGAHVDTLRYVLAVLVVVATPPGILLWVAIHPFARFWRRLGAGGTYAVLGPLALGLVAVLFAHRDLLLGRDRGTCWPCAALGAGLLAAAAVLAIARRRQLRFGTLAGLPELSPERYPPRLLQEGVYARVRHPRYLELLLAVFSYTVVSHYTGAWVVAVASVPALWLVVVLEERELRERFGSAWDDYARRVPRFVPSSRRGSSGRAA